MRVHAVDKHRSHVSLQVCLLVVWAVSMGLMVDLCTRTEHGFHEILTAWQPQPSAVMIPVMTSPVLMVLVLLNPVTSAKGNTPSTCLISCFTIGHGYGFCRRWWEGWVGVKTKAAFSRTSFSPLDRILIYQVSVFLIVRIIDEEREGAARVALLDTIPFLTHTLDLRWVLPHQLYLAGMINIH